MRILRAAGLFGALECASPCKWASCVRPIGWIQLMHFHLQNSLPSTDLPTCSWKTILHHFTTESHVLSLVAESAIAGDLQQHRKDFEKWFAITTELSPGSRGFSPFAPQFKQGQIVGSDYCIDHAVCPPSGHLPSRKNSMGGWPCTPIEFL